LLGVLDERGAIWVPLSRPARLAVLPGDTIDTLYAIDRASNADGSRLATLYF
jgi:hypothetical protein